MRAMHVQADHALRREMRALQLHCNDIDSHEAALDAQIRRLDGAKQQVEAHLREKDEGEQVRPARSKQGLHQAIVSARAHSAALTASRQSFQVHRCYARVSVRERVSMCG
jgi:hypothetical protein